MKWLKRIGLGILFSPFMLIVIFVLYEVFGMCANNNQTNRQTKQLKAHLESEISDLQIINIYSKTGNTAGTGNHVDCLSSVTFSTQMPVSEIKDKMSKYYTFDEWSCYVSQTENGTYLFYLNTSAPFPNNIEGH